MTFTTENQDGIDALDVQALVAAKLGHGWVSGCSPSLKTNTSAIEVDVTSGTVKTNSSTTSVSSGTLTLDDGDNDFPRKDVVYADVDGALQVAKGAPMSAVPTNEEARKTSTPRPPDLADLTAVPIAEVWVPARASGSDDLNDGSVDYVRDRRLPMTGLDTSNFARTDQQETFTENVDVIGTNVGVTELVGHKINIKDTDADQYGYIQFENSSGQRGGYFGNGDGANKLDLILDNATYLNFSGGEFQIDGDLRMKDGGVINMEGVNSKALNFYPNSATAWQEICFHDETDTWQMGLSYKTDANRLDIKDKTGTGDIANFDGSTGNVTIPNGDMTVAGNIESSGTITLDGTSGQDVRVRYHQDGSRIWQSFYDDSDDVFRFYNDQDGGDYVLTLGRDRSVNVDNGQLQEQGDRVATRSWTNANADVPNADYADSSGQAEHVDDAQDGEQIDFSVGTTDPGAPDSGVRIWFDTS